MTQQSSYDVVIIGAGMAGLTAALAAAKNNAKTLLVERHPYAGGAFTAGMVLHIAGLVDHRRLCQDDQHILDPNNWIVQGLASELHKRLEKHNAAEGPHWDHEPAKVIFDQILNEYGVDVLYGTQFHSATVEQGQITSIQLIYRTNAITINAKMFIDASGDGDLGEAAGVEFFRGRETDNKMSPATLSYMIADADCENGESVGQMNELLRQAWQEKQIPANMRPAIICPRFSEGKQRNELWCSVVRQWGDITDPIEYSRMEQQGRFVGWEIFQYLKANTKACKNAYLSSICHQIWPRENRHLKTQYAITANDVRHQAVFKDVVARGAFYLDLHSTEVHSIGFDLDEHRPEKDTYFEIPLRSLIPADIDNLLLAGRTIGATHHGHSATRVMGTGIATGQAAGTAAAMLTDNNKTTSDIDINALQETLRSQNVII